MEEYLRFEEYSKEKKTEGKTDYMKRAELLIIDNSKILIIKHTDGTYWLPGGYRKGKEKPLTTAINGTKETFNGALPKGKLYTKPFTDKNYDRLGLQCKIYKLELEEKFWPNGIINPWEGWQWNEKEEITKIKGITKGLIEIIKEIS